MATKMEQKSSNGPSAARTQTTFAVDPATQAVLEHLKEKFGVTTNTAVIRKALALADIAADAAGDSHSVTIEDTNGEKLKVILTG